MATTELNKIASQVRRDIVRMVHAQQSGHPGGSLGCADFLTALYFKVLKIDTNLEIVLFKQFLNYSYLFRNKFCCIWC